MAINKQGGWEPNTPEELERARKSDLITLPEKIEGTNCGNCQYFSKLTKNVGNCHNSKVKQTVTERNCCYFWNAAGVYRPWLNK